MRRQALRVLVPFLALAVVAAACGDDDEGVFGPAESSQGTTSPTTGAGGTDDSAAESTEATAAPTTAPGGGDGGGEVSELLERYQGETLRATYLFGEGDDAQVVVVSQDPSQDPPVSAFIILEGPDPDAPEEGRILTIGGDTVFCGPPGADNVCLGMPGDDPSATPFGAMLGPLFGFLFAAEYESLPGFEVDRGSTTVAGRSGLCFTVTPQAIVQADVEFLRQCIDAELGFTLLLEGKDAGGETVERYMELIEFAMPQPADFEPTGEMMTLPGS